MVILNTSCKKNRPDKLEGDKAQLIGNWDWHRSRHRVGCQQFSDIFYYSPSTENINYSASFEESGLLKLYKESELLNEYFIKFDFFTKKENGWRFAILPDNNGNNRFAGLVYNDSLELYSVPYEDSEDGCNTYVNYFYRE